MPMDTAIRRPCRRASYSAALLDSVYIIWSTYWTVSPVGDVKTTPAPSPANILEPSKCMIQFEYVSYSLGSSASVHSAMKSARTCDLMAPWLVGYIKWEELYGPLCYPARCIAVVQDIVKRYF